MLQEVAAEHQVEATPAEGHHRVAGRIGDVAHHVDAVLRANVEVHRLDATPAQRSEHVVLYPGLDLGAHLARGGPHETGVTRSDIRQQTSGRKRPLGERKRPLGELVRARGWNPRRLADRLVSPWRGRVSRSHLLRLRDRARRTMTQTHLMEHMFSHPFHQPSLQARLPRIIGAHGKEIRRLRGQCNLSRMEIARLRGRTPSQVERAVRGLIRAAARRGVQRRETSREQAAAWVSYQDRRLGGWLHGKPNWGTARAAPAVRCPPRRGG